MNKQNTPPDLRSIVPINVAKDGTARCITAHYHKCGWEDFAPYKMMPNTAILEIWNED